MTTKKNKHVPVIWKPLQKVYDFFYSRYPDLYDAYCQLIIPPTKKTGQVEVYVHCPADVKDKLDKIVREYYAAKNN